MTRKNRPPEMRPGAEVEPGETISIPPPNPKEEAFIDKFEQLAARVTAVEAKVESPVVKPAPPEIVPLERDEFPPEWGEVHGWKTIVPKKTGKDIIINGFVVPLVKGEICELPGNVIPVAIDGGYL